MSPPKHSPASRTAPRRRLGGKVVPAPIPLAPREPAPCSVFGPKASDRLSVGPGLRCALRYVAHLVGRIVPGQGQLLNSQGCPRNFFVTHRFDTFIHRSCTAIPTVGTTLGRNSQRRHTADMNVQRGRLAISAPNPLGVGLWPPGSHKRALSGFRARIASIPRSAPSTWIRVDSGAVLPIECAA